MCNIRHRLSCTQSYVLLLLLRRVIFGGLTVCRLEASGSIPDLQWGSLVKLFHTGVPNVHGLFTSNLGLVVNNDP